MLTLEAIKVKLKDMNIRAVSKACGLHENTVYSLVHGKRPSYDTVKALSDYLEELYSE